MCLAMPCELALICHINSIEEKGDEIVPLMHELYSIKGNFSHNSVELLSSKIISMDRIREDF